MNDITHKSYSLREARSVAVVRVGCAETIQAVCEGRVPKGDVFQHARIAAMLGVKKTAELIPDCHPMPVEGFDFSGRTEELDIILEVYVKTVYKTGVEVEAMHGASVAALTVYDMLKPIDKSVHICEIKLLEKRGGKSDRKIVPDESWKAQVVVVSDSTKAGRREDTSGKKALKKLQELGVKQTGLQVVADEKDEILKACQDAEMAGVRLLLFTGGTGLSFRDITPEVVESWVERPVPGIMEWARQYGQQRSPFAFLSRGVAGQRGNMLVLCMPGSEKGVEECMNAIFPQVFHALSVMDGKPH